MIVTLLDVVLEGLPPTVNHMYRTSRHGVRYKTAEGKGWENFNAAVIREAWGDKDPWDGDVEVKIVFFAADQKRWDVDNRIKALLDALEASGAVGNDAQVKALTAFRVDGYGQGKPAATRLIVRAVT